MRRILVLDDDNFFLAVTRDILISDGYDVRVANNLLDFELNLRIWKPDLICSDIHMPDIQGDRLCSSLKKLFGHDIPIVLVSADEIKLRTLAAKPEVDAYLHKRDVSVRLLDIVEDLLGHTPEKER